MRGSIGFNELQKMPIKQYIILKKAVDIESIIQRRVNLQDINRAFHDPAPLMKQLEKELMTLLHGSKKKANNMINWKKDADWELQLSKFKV